MIFDKENIRKGILAYFTISFKEIDIKISVEDKKISKSMVKKIDGISKNSTEIRALLLGQVGKNFATEGNKINLEIILEHVYSVFKSVQHLIGGRIILLECKNDIKLIDYYKKHGFVYLQKENNQVQMIKVFNPQ